MTSVPNTQKSLLILSQVYPPDPASVGQHIADVATEMARRGHRVRVVTANRGYDDPHIVYPSRDTIQGVEIRRLSLSSYGKKRFVLRMFGTLVFMLESFFAVLFTPHVDGILFSTSPPLVGFAVALAAMLRRIPIAYWVMDLNPDQLIILKKIRSGSWAARLLEAVNRFSLRRSALVVALDRFMAERLRALAPLEAKLVTIPPWPHDDHAKPAGLAANPFRAKHNLDGAFVIMYSGNHSSSNPLTTLLMAAIDLKDDSNLRFLFVGGGLGKKEVEAAIRDHSLSNVVSLPYQPLADLGYSLSAADIHVVTLGSEMVGIIHPCKIYGAMAVARPILFFGPKPSHISDLLDSHSIGWQVSHGDVAGAVGIIRRLRQLPPGTLREMGALAYSVVKNGINREKLCGEFCNTLEKYLKFL